MTKEQFIEKYKGKAVWCKTEKLAEEFLKECKNLKLIKKDYNLVKKNIIYILGDKAVNKSIGIMHYDTKIDIKESNEYFKNIDVEIIEYKPEEKPKNLIPQIAKMLGVEIGEEFKIKGWSSYPYKFDGVLLSRTNGNEWEHATADDYEYILTSECTIQKLPKKPQLTEAERVILENLPKEYKWICRNQNNNLILVTKEPFKVSNENSYWNCRNKDNGENTLLRIQAFNHLFQFIKFEDEEPYNIEELLKGE